MNKWFELKHPEKLDSPALLVFPDGVKANIETAIKMAGDVQRLRPHVKTSKSPGAVRLMMEAGIQKFKCATIAEAEMLGVLQAKDVLLAYQPQGPKIQRFIELVHQFSDTKFSCLVDNELTAKEQSDAFEKAGLIVPVYLDMNVGMNRTGILPGEKAVALYRYCSTLEGIKIKGLHVYDGHIRNPDVEEKKKEVNTAFQPIEKMLKQLESEGFSSLQVIAGGSPSFSVHCNRPGVECSPGTFIYWDHGYAGICPEQDFLPAAVLMTRVVSFPAEGMLTTDLGHKSVASENEITKRIFFLNAENLKPVGQSEEHLVMAFEQDSAMKLGQILYGIPYHICPTVNLYERAYLLQNWEVTGEWKTLARDRKISI